MINSLGEPQRQSVNTKGLIFTFYDTYITTLMINVLDYLMWLKYDPQLEEIFILSAHRLTVKNIKNYTISYLIDG